MKTKSFCLIILCFSIILTKVQAQSVEDAFKQAKKENKIVMISIESPTCNECNEVASKGISSNLVKSSINNNCIYVKVKKLPDEFYGSGTLYILSADFFGVLFFDADKNILDFMSGSSTSYIPYLDHIEKALKEKQTPEATLSQLKKNYYNNIGSFDAIKKVIEKIRKLNLEPQQQVLDELTQKAPEDSAASLSFLQFIMKAAPIYGSIAEQYIQKNKDNYNMAWFRMSQPERVVINNRIYGKSLLKAIADKDMNYAYRVASNRQMTFASSTNIEDGQKSNQETMLQYYKGINDTTNYLRNVANFYERFYMSTKVETIQKEDSIRKEKTFKTIPPNLTNPSSAQKDSIGFRTVTFSPRTAYFASQLNNGAWTVYTYTKDKNYLTKALAWAKHGLEFSETSAIMDTYARLLYKTGNKEEAIIWEQKAIDANKTKAISSADYEKVLILMKSGAVKIDDY